MQYKRILFSSISRSDHEKLNKEMLQAAEQGQIRRLRITLSAGADVDYVDADQKATALHMASSGGHADCIEFLVEQGADLHAGEGVLLRTPLHLAAASGKSESCRVLVVAIPKVGLNIRDRGGNTALH